MLFVFQRRVFFRFIASLWCFLSVNVVDIQHSKIRLTATSTSTSKFDDGHKSHIPVWCQSVLLGLLTMPVCDRCDSDFIVSSLSHLHTKTVKDLQNCNITSPVQFSDRVDAFRFVKLDDLFMRQPTFCS